MDLYRHLEIKEINCFTFFLSRTRQNRLFKVQHLPSGQMNITAIIATLRQRCWPTALTRELVQVIHYFKPPRRKVVVIAGGGEAGGGGREKNVPCGVRTLC